jgi:hypothetical protein
MQVAKYIFYLSRRGRKAEEELTDRYKDQMPSGIEIKVTNPNGFVIIGRENRLSQEQRLDLEVVKRKYKNVIDIITYDNLLERLSFMIEQVRRS